MCILSPRYSVHRVKRDKKEVIYMYGSEFSDFSFWWIVPIFMMILCFLMMRRRKGSMMCGFGSSDIDSKKTRTSDSAIDILDKRYASGEINKQEYEEKKRTLTESIGLINDQA
jgi:uncharacterized membrane protein